MVNLLNFKYKLALRVLLFAVLVVYAYVSFSALHNVNAQIFFGDEDPSGVSSPALRQCSESTVSECPFGTRREGEGSLGNKNMACLPLSSDFCSKLTDSQVVAHKTAGQQYCVGNPKPGVICTDTVMTTKFIPGIHGVKSYKLNYNSPSITTKLLDLFGPNSEIYQYAAVAGDPDAKKLGCIEVDNNGVDEKKIWVPRLGDTHDPAGGGAKVAEYSTATRNLKRIYDAYQLGIVIRRGDEKPVYCEDPNDVYIRPENAGLKEGRCYRKPVGNACVISSIPGTGVDTQTCIKGFSPPTTLDDVEPIYSHNFDLRDSYNKFKQLDPSQVLCKSTSKDRLEASSSKGCSDYTEFDPATNIVKASDVDKYYECVRCIYGGETFRKPFDENPDQSNGGARGGIVGFDGGVPANALGVPAKNERITPSNEYYAVPLQGNFYSDIGCIDTSDTSSIINTVIRLALGLMALLVVIRIMQGSLMMQQIQQSDPEAVQEGKDIIVSALLALMLLIFSAAILNFLGVNVLQLEGFTPFT